MASKGVASIALLLSLNLLFFTLVSSNKLPFPQPSKSPSLHRTNCPKDILKTGVCADLLNSANGFVGTALSMTPCCMLIMDMTNFEAALCLCTALKSNMLGTNLNVPASLSLLLNYCGKLPSGFQCA